MKTIINELTIKNFKSIKEIKLDCKQVNIFIGKPNTGKSNILEAISLLSGGLVPGKKFFDGSIYYETLDNLFYDQEISEIVSIESNIGTVQLSYFQGDDKFGFFGDTYKTNAIGNVLKFSSVSEAFQNFIKDKEFAESITDKINAETYVGAKIYGEGKVEQITSLLRTRVHNYLYKRLRNHNNNETGYLLPPHGDNLWGVFQRTLKLREITGELFKQFGLDLVLVRDNENSKKIVIQKNLEGISYQLPYSLVADTLQRMIFHLAAIYSNRDAVILFEEPEAHTYAPYQSYLADEIIADEQNQYFITTHSNDIFDSLLREAPEKVAVFIVGYEDYKTKVRPLTDEEVNDYLTGYASIFQNLDGYSVT